MRKLITNSLENCVGCNRCVRVCPITEANVSSIFDGNIKVEADNSKCVVCGACLLVCHHGSRAYEDDTERFFEDLANGVPISLFAAPAVQTNFQEWQRMFTWLRSLGAVKIYDVSLGADICTWAHIRTIEKGKTVPLISQPCPSIVNYILMHKNELAKHLSPIHSPMLCTAIYMKKYDNLNTKIAALSPCIAKAHEFDETQLVDYNVTFKGLAKYMHECGIALPAHPSGFDNFQAGLGVLYPLPGGLRENIEHYFGKKLRIDKSEGTQMVYKALDEYAVNSTQQLPALFDVLNCMEGCNVGTGCIHHGEAGAVNMFDIGFTMHKARTEALGKNQGQYLEDIFSEFDKSLHLQDFVRTYTTLPARNIPVSPSSIDNAFAILDKFDDDSKKFDCGACGCDTCYEMAVRLAKNIDVPQNCLKKAHEDAKRDHDAAVDNMARFDTVLKDTTTVKDVTSTIVSDVHEINKVIESYNKLIADIEEIAMSINIISLNASVEASRAGQNGRAFAVVAEEIRKLSKSSDESAKRTKAASTKADTAINNINASVEKISSSVKASYENVLAISESTKNILDASQGEETAGA
ncbi:MAG: methyl-accepting chemotaxis protein [Oscillospiraceae bacterium]|nr:methyl-accepting chemotaxis protein [Oscillospiraceae bacterium]